MIYSKLINLKINKFVDEASSTSVSKKKTREEVIAVTVSPNGKHLAVGYQNGIIKIFSLTQNETTVNFHGHKSTITTLIFTQDSATLISGSKVFINNEIYFIKKMTYFLFLLRIQILLPGI